MRNLSLCMIVRDAQADLPACLESVRGIADELVVADTGSRDATTAVAKQYGARVFSIPWEDDFARARNQSLEQVHTDWVLVLDADEQLGPDAACAIPPLLQQKEIAGYLVTIRNYVLNCNERLWDRPAQPNHSGLPASRNFPAYVEHENVRLFRRHPDIYFVGRVHETVGSRILSNGMKLARAGFLIHHFGMAASQEIRDRKNRLYRELGRLKVQEMPDNAQAHFELGLVELDNFHNNEEALACFERAWSLDPNLAVAWFFGAVAQGRLGRPAEALECVRRARSLGHSPTLAAELEGDAHYNLRHFDAAILCYQQALREASDSASVESKLGLAEARAGLVQAGLVRLRRAIERQPELPELHDRLIVTNVWLGRLEQAAVAAERKLEAVEPHPDQFLRAASIRARMGQNERAAGLLRRGLGLFPQAERLRQCLAELLGEEAARPALPPSGCETVAS